MKSLPELYDKYNPIPTRRDAENIKKGYANDFV